MTPDFASGAVAVIVFLMSLLGVFLVIGAVGYWAERKNK